MATSRRKGVHRVPPINITPICAVVMIALVSVFLVGVLTTHGAEPSEDEWFTMDGVVYRPISDNEVSVTDYTGSAVDVKLPMSVSHDGKEYNVTSIGDHAFNFDVGLMSVTIPEGVTVIGKYAFYGCIGMASITLPDSVRKIDNYAFSDCAGLTSMTIPRNVTVLGDMVFRGCTGIAEFYVDPMNVSIETIDGVLFSHGAKGLIQYPGARTGVYVIPHGVEFIEDHAFEGCEGLRSVTIREGVTAIGASAFRHCTGLVSATIGDSVVSIGANAFYGCVGLMSVTIPDGVPIIEDSAFGNCRGLTSLSIGKGVGSIGTGAFEDCIGLRSLTIPDGVEYLGNSAFHGCTGLTSVTIPRNVTFIHSYAFGGCIGLTGFKVDSDNPVFTTDDAGVLFGDGGRSLIAYPGGRPGDYTIPDDVSGIDTGAFEGCSKLTSITIGKGATTIGMHVFSGCTGLTSITIPDNISSVGTGAFESCVGLRSVVLGSGISEIGASSFRGCTNVTSYEVDPDNRSFDSVDGIVFNEERTELVIYPAGRTGSYVIPDGIIHIRGASFFGCKGLTAISIPHSVSTIGNYAFYGCAGLLSFVVDPDNRSFISADGVLFTYDGRTLLQYPGSKEGAYEVPDGVTSIQTHAFKGCSGLICIGIPNSVTPGEWMGFIDCPKLETIMIHEPNEGMTTIEGVVYSEDMTMVIRCPSGKGGSLALPEGVYLLGDGSFSSTGLDNIVIGGGDRMVVGESAFGGCNPHLTFKSGREGYGLEVYKDVRMTQKITVDELSSGFGGVLYLKWFEMPSETPRVGHLIGVVAGSIMIAMAALLVSVSRRD